MSWWCNNASLGVLLPAANYYIDGTWQALPPAYDALNDFHKTPDLPANKRNVYFGLMKGTDAYFNALYVSGRVDNGIVSSSDNNTFSPEYSATDNLNAYTNTTTAQNALFELSGDLDDRLFSVKTLSSNYYMRTKFTTSLTGTEFSPAFMTQLPYDCSISSLINVNAPNRQTFTSLTGRTVANHNENVTHSYQLTFTFSRLDFLLSDLTYIFEQVAKNGAPLVYLPAKEDVLQGADNTHVYYTDRKPCLIMPSVIPQLQQTAQNIFTFTVEGVDAL